MLSNFASNQACKLFNLPQRHSVHFCFSAESQAYVYLIDALLPQNFCQPSLHSHDILVVIPIPEVQRYGDDLSLTIGMSPGGTYQDNIGWFMVSCSRLVISALPLVQVLGD